MSTQRLPAEWEPQDAVLLTWPHKNTAWNWILEDVTELYEALATVIVDYADVIIALPADMIDEVYGRLEAMGAPMEYIYLYPCDSDDTWARDHGPLTVETENGFTLLDFQFNGWGNKFPHQKDNQLSQQLFALNAFPHATIAAQDWVLEGGSIETDGQGTLLTTSSCLLNKNRNPNLTKDDIETRLKAAFGVRKINWLDHGYLAGDDTDSHIDTLARLCPNNTIVYTACDDEQDEHYAELKKMEEQLKTFTNADGEPYRLLPLPWSGPVLGRDSDERLPSTYANFLVINEAVLVPIYELPMDEDALEVISQAFPGFEILGIPCNALIEQGGSLHCITMQIPEGVLEPL
ncbi:agmatine deiminase [Cellvibrio mixtus]|uniref:Agmatine deiminase n=1 Tax=Cellvibrio mixtus TaxID=39650 RepID=A0A266Q4W2_9GAMM|nr:agmatine deiminase family protein [Cellvibrio mixtus]OZY84908.1 agmatine deiminase [Cellvibrio mixtus]